MLLTLMLCGDNSTAMTLVRSSRPALADPYAARPLPAPLPRERGDVDELAATCLHHLTRDRLSDQKRSCEINANDLVPLLKAELKKRRVAADAGVVDEDVDAAE